ncbi:MAG: RNA polymerase-binding protein DksA [Candidatus Oxydemutatoraceae bacterium WSBS_2016_MAG_OTU14]
MAKKPVAKKSSAVDKTSKQKSTIKRGARLIVHKERTKKQSRKNKSMTQEKLQYFRSLLLKWKEDLMQEVDKTVSHMRSDTTQLADPADRATKEEEFSFELKTRNRERKLIQKIDNALENIAKNKYGYCISCGAAIGFKRLQVRPTALVCIDCKTLQESQEKQTLFN